MYQRFSAMMKYERENGGEGVTLEDSCVSLSLRDTETM